MLHSNALLKRFEQLWQALQPRPLELEIGSRLARGFADLGYEEFLYQGGRKLASLYTGKIGELPEGHEHFFFMVYSVDEMLILLTESGADFERLIPDGHGGFLLELINSKGQKVSFAAVSVIEVLISALIGVLNEK